MIPKSSHQLYYIHTPAYRSNSAGVKALYLLCHFLNSRGCKSYIMPDKGGICHKEFDDLYYSLNRPILDLETFEFHQNNNYNPIIIYSDTVDGNPLGARNVVRYMMNYNNLFGDYKKGDNELVMAYSKQIAQSLGLDDSKVLFIPTSNTDIFYPPEINIKREGSCVYLGKYQDFHKGKQLEITKKSKVITRIKGSITPTQIADLLRKSELLYLYENSAIGTEAVLCGCPVVFIPNKFLKENEVHLSRNELGIDGYAFNVDEKSIQRAKETVYLGRKNYLDSYGIFQKQLDGFINMTQSYFGGMELEVKNKEIINREYFFGPENQYSFDELSAIIHQNSILTKDEFNKILPSINKYYPKRNFSKKVKLVNSNERVVFKTKISIKNFNLGRLLTTKSLTKSKNT